MLYYYPSAERVEDINLLRATLTQEFYLRLEGFYPRLDS